MVAANQQRQAAKGQAAVSTATGQYNARVDEAQARQFELDAEENVRATRRDESVYLSRQKTAYASAGVLTDGGSPLGTMASTAGAFEQRAQQTWSDAQRRAEQARDAGLVGQLYSQAQADAYRTQGRIAMINGAARATTTVLSAAAGAYSGVASGGSSFGSGNLAGADAFDSVPVGGYSGMYA